MSAIQPIENFVFEGLLKRMQQVFGCICIHTNANDKTKALARVFEGRPVVYPYMFLVVKTLSQNKESYTTNRLARRGVSISNAEGQSQTVRILPTNFEFEVEYVTNKFQGLEQGSVLAFSRRWLFAQRCGYLKFNIKYGRLVLWISATPSDSIEIPTLENKVETETAYKSTANLTVHGYVSEPELGSQGVTQELQINEVIVGADGSVAGSQFFAFT